MNNAIIIQHAIPGLGYDKCLDVTRARHTEYAKRHNFDLRVVLGWVEKRFETAHNAAYVKCVLIRQALKEGYQSVVWLDADSIICKMDVDLRDACVNIGVNKNLIFMPGHYGVGIMYIQNNSEVQNFMDVWLDTFPGSQWKGLYWFEQAAFNDLVYNKGYMSLIHELPNCWHAYNTSPCSYEDVIVQHWCGGGPVQGRIRAMRTVLARLEEDGR